MKKKDNFWGKLMLDLKNVNTQLKIVLNSSFESSILVKELKALLGEIVFKDKGLVDIRTYLTTFEMQIRHDDFQTRRSLFVSINFLQVNLKANLQVFGAFSIVNKLC